MQVPLRLIDPLITSLTTFSCCFNFLIIPEESTNQYLNENWRPVNDGLKGVIANTIEDILLRIMRKIFDQVPASYLISDIPKPSEFYSKKP